MATDSDKLLSFHFDCGNSTVGPIGFCGRVKARSKREALSIMQRAIPTEVKLTPVSEIDGDNARVEYIEVYISPNNIRIKNVDCGEEI